MALFVVRHQHDPAHCPAQDADMGAMLLNHLSRPSVRAHGVTIQGEAVVQGEHTLYLIAEAPDEERVRRFMAPFAAAGTVEVLAASTCVRVVASGGCSEPMPEIDDAEVAVDPEDACQQAIDAGLLVHRAHPLNGETSIPALIGGVVMPNAHFYVRNHFQIPRLEPSTWRLTVGGLVERPLSLTPARAGHDAVRDEGGHAGVRGQRPRRPDAAASTVSSGGSVRSARRSGPACRSSRCSTAPGCGPLPREVVFRGADHGVVDGRGAISFERSLSRDTARDSQVLLAYAMNGEALPRQHGYPLRLIVPSWYGVASVKWLTEIEAVPEPVRRVLPGRQVLVRGAAWRRDRTRSRHPPTGAGPDRRARRRRGRPPRRGGRARRRLVRRGADRPRRGQRRRRPLVRGATRR